MRRNLEPPLKPKDGLVLLVLAIARISTPNQDELSLADQEAMYRDFLRECYSGPTELRVIATQASGEWLDRPEIAEVKQLIATGAFDLVIAEDLGRIMRDLDAVKFCGFCEDHDTRLIAINDHVDTGREGWDDAALLASWGHKKTNEHTSRRIKQRLNSRFERDGGAFGCELFGYIKPPGCRGDQDVQKDPEATPIYDRWFRMLEDGATYAEVADWLNANGIPTGPHCRADKWTPETVSRITHNPILKGVRE
ncbi:MAG TPA: recombinase family protein, partial [Tepidisphaeraceae bacterium]